MGYMSGMNVIMFENILCTCQYDSRLVNDENVVEGRFEKLEKTWSCYWSIRGGPKVYRHLDLQDN